MPTKLTIVLLAALPLLFAAPSHAALTWQSNAHTYAAKAADTRVSHAFTFTNDSDEPVTIDSVKTSCGCTTAKLAKRTYSPGETGTIQATFDFGPRTGKQVKTITVKTDESRDGGFQMIDGLG